MSAHGGPAFPGSARVWRAGYVTQDTEPVPGMTLRDYFAAKAMQAALSNRDAFPVKDDNELARRCYGTADAMLRARSTV